MSDEVRKEDLQVEVLREPSPWPKPSIVRITHLPTGVVVTSDEFKSTLAAKQDALVKLREALQHIDGSI